MVVSLILPCYNPPHEWEKTVLFNYNTFSQRVQTPVELVVVMDGVSETVTAEALAFLEKNIVAVRLISYTENQGKGYAIRKGVEASAGDIILYTDIDFPYTPDSIYAVYDSLAKNECDVAAGIKDDAYFEHVPPLRRFISRYLQLLIRIFLSMPVTDTQCGLKGFRSNVKPLFLETTIKRYLFDLEFIRNCFKSKKIRVKPIPVTLNENIHFRRMNYRILLPEMFNFIRLLLK